MLEMFLGRILYASSKILYCKTCIWVLRLVQSDWWLNFSHVERRCYTSFISNFEHIAASTAFRQFYRRPRLGLAQSSHQKNLESFFHPTLIAFAVDFEQVDISSVMFCFLWHAEKRFLMSPMGTALQRTQFIVSLCQLVNLLCERCFNSVLVQYWQRRQEPQVAIFIRNIWYHWNHVIYWSQCIMQIDISYLCWKLAYWNLLVWMPKPCGPLLCPSGYQFWTGLYKAFCLALLTLKSGNKLFISSVNTSEWGQPMLLWCFHKWLSTNQLLLFVSIAKLI